MFYRKIMKGLFTYIDLKNNFLVCIKMDPVPSIVLPHHRIYKYGNNSPKQGKKLSIRKSSNHKTF